MHEQVIPVGLCQCGCGERTRIAVRNNAKNRAVLGQPLRFVSGHQNRRSPVDYIVEDRGHDTPCWIWQRVKVPGGYGQLGREGKKHYAHRWYYEQHVGPIPDGLDLDHLCRVRACCNPTHLEPVTRAENIQRGNPAKLTADGVREIRRLYDSGHAAKVVAADFGVCVDVIYKIGRRQSWRNVPEQRAA